MQVKMNLVGLDSINLSLEGLSVRQVQEIRDILLAAEAANKVVPALSLNENLASEIAHTVKRELSDLSFKFDLPK